MLRVVETMTDTPGVCACCGGNPPGPDGQFQEAILAEGVDIDCGANLYICHECASTIADLIGRVPEKEHKGLQRSYRKLDREHTELLRKYGRLQKNATRVVKGRKAAKELAHG